MVSRTRRQRGQSVSTERRCIFGVSQLAKSVIDSICGFIRKETGFACNSNWAGTAWKAQWSAKSAVDKTMRMTKRYLRSARKKEQYRHAKKFLRKIRAHKKAKRR